MNKSFGEKERISNVLFERFDISTSVISNIVILHVQMKLRDGPLWDAAEC